MDLPLVVAVVEEEVANNEMAESFRDIGKTFFFTYVISESISYKILTNHLKPLISHLSTKLVEKV